MAKAILNKDKICGAAIQLIEEQGLEQLSMRKLAERLEVKAASLYNHISNKSELLDMIMEYLYSKMVPLKNKQDWKVHLTELANHTRDGLLTHPNLVTLFATRPIVSGAALAQAEQTIGILIIAGFKQSNALMIFRNLNVFVLGHVAAEVGTPPGSESDYKEPSLADINLDYYPMLNKVNTYKSNFNFDKGFKFGLDCMLTGLEASLKVGV